jgi:hypothetical protein
MKLHRFNEFVSINEGYQSIDLNDYDFLFLIDGAIYHVEEYELNVDWDHQHADPEVGIHNAYFDVENYELTGVLSVSKLTNPEITQQILELFPEETELSAELARIGFIPEVTDDKVTSIAFQGDYSENWKILLGPELKDFSSKFVNLYDTKQLKAISGGSLSAAIDSEIEYLDTPEDDGPDYDDAYDDRY